MYNVPSLVTDTFIHELHYSCLSEFFFAEVDLLQLFVFPS